MKNIILTVLLALGCGEGGTHTHPAASTEDAKPSVTVIERIIATTIDEPDEQEEPEEESDEEQEDEESDEDEREDEEEDEPDERDEEEQEQVEASAPVANFNYVEWTAEAPTLGKPKVPGPPYRYLNENSRRGIYDQLRKYRWLMWDAERMLDRRAAIDLEWVENWEAWEERGEGIAFARKIRRKSDGGESEARNVVCGRYIRYQYSARPIFYPLRQNDKTLDRLAREQKQLDGHNPLWAVLGYGGGSEGKKIQRFIQYLGRDLEAYGEAKAFTWFKQVKGLWGEYQRTKSREHEALNPGTRMRASYDRLRKALGCHEFVNTCFNSSLTWNNSYCLDNHETRIYTKGMEITP